MNAFLDSGFASTVTPCSTTPNADGYLGALNGLPFHIHPTATPSDWVALEAAIADGSVTVAAYAAPVAPTLTLVQQAYNALNAGLAVTSTSAPALSATYAVDTASQAHITAEITSILLNGVFADGLSAVAWPDVTGTTHLFSLAQFKSLASAIAAYAAGLYKVINGTLTTLPAASATIS